MPDGGQPDDVDGTSGSDIIIGNGNANEIHGGDGTDLLLGEGGDDLLFGDKGRDLLFGGDGDDFLDGGSNKDSLFGEEGNDLIVYDRNDVVIDGGEGIDVLLSSDDLSLDELLSNTDAANGPLVSRIEVLLTGGETKGITSLMELAGKGISVEDGTVTLSEGWTQGEDNGSVHVFTNDGLTLETTLDVGMDDATAAIVLTLQTTNV